MTHVDAGPSTTSSWATLLQVVSYNLRRAREERGLTQAALGSRLEELTGTKWSAVTVGHAESGWGEKPGRIRRFDANEIMAFSLVLRVPLVWFFLPPPVLPSGYPPSSGDDRWITSRESDGEAAVSTRALAALVLVDPAHGPGNDLFLQRLRNELPQHAHAYRADRADARGQRLAQRLGAAIEEYYREASEEQHVEE